MEYTHKDRKRKPNVRWYENFNMKDFNDIAKTVNLRQIHIILEEPWELSGTFTVAVFSLIRYKKLCKKIHDPASRIKIMIHVRNEEMKKSVRYIFKDYENDYILIGNRRYKYHTKSAKEELTILSKENGPDTISDPYEYIKSLREA